MKLHTNITLELSVEALANEVRFCVNRRRKELKMEMGSPITQVEFEETLRKAVATYLQDVTASAERGHITWLKK